MLTRLIYVMMKKGTSNFIIKEVQKTWLCYNSDYIHPFKKYVTLTIIKGIKKSIVNNYLWASSIHNAVSMLRSAYYIGCTINLSTKICMKRHKKVTFYTFLKTQGSQQSSDEYKNTFLFIYWYLRNKTTTNPWLVIYWTSTIISHIHQNDQYYTSLLKYIYIYIYTT